MTRQDLIDLAIEYDMIRSTLHFNDLNAKQQAAILKQIQTVASPQLVANCQGRAGGP